MISSIYKNNYDPQATAIIYKNQTTTYGELDQKVSQYATYFTKLGVKKGDKVVLSSINCPEFIYSYLGITKIGGIVIPVNLLLTFDEISYIIKNSEAKTMIFHPAVLSKLKSAKQFTKQTIAHLIDTKFAKLLIKQILGINIIIFDDNFKNEVNSIYNYNFEENTDENSISTFLYTSGTTGKPKAAMLSHKNLHSNVVQLLNSVDGYQQDNFLCVLPMFHVFGYTTSVLIPLYLGAKITILDSFQPKELIDTLIKEKVSIFCGVPSMYIVLLNAVKKNVAFPDLRLAIAGGASMPIEIFRRSKNELNFPIIEGYGLSEASPVVTLNPVGKQKEGSIGLPLWGIECKVVDENGNELPIGEPGELIAKGDNVMLGYYKQEEHTKEAIKDRWLYTGDIAKKDEDGYYYIVERKKDLIIVGGFNVYPREVEEVIYTYPKVKESAVVGIEDPLRGEYVKAFIVLKEGEECGSRELLRYLKQHLAAYKIPREIDFIDELPKNSTGKVLKRILRENNKISKSKDG